MRMRFPNKVGRAVQTDPTLLCYASAITKQKKCWELLAQKFDRFQTLRNNKKQHRIRYSNGRDNVGSCWATILRPFERGFTDQFFGPDIESAAY